MNQVEFSVSVYCNDQDYDQVRGIVEEEVNEAEKRITTTLKDASIKNTHISVADVSEIGEIDD